MLLPPERSFLVRLDANADPALGTLVGRVEHLNSGTRANFSSSEELEGFIKKILAQEGCVDQKEC